MTMRLGCALLLLSSVMLHGTYGLSLTSRRAFVEAGCLSAAASVMVPASAFAADGDLSMPTPEEQKAMDVS